MISPARHGLFIVSQGEFTKRWQASSAHPDLEFFVIGKIGRWVFLGISVWPALLPIGRNFDIVKGVFRLTIQRLVAVPGNAFVGHVVRHVPRRAVSDVGQNWIEKGVVEEGVGNKTTRVVWFTIGTQTKRIARPLFDSRCRYGNAR